MKKVLKFMLIMSMTAGIVGCANNDEPVDEPEDTTTVEPEQETETPTTPEELETNTDGEQRILIAYFTEPEADGSDASASASRQIVDGELQGSTEVIANYIQAEVGGDLFSIETMHSYPAAHDDLTAFARNEVDSDARPELSTTVDIDSYDVIFLEFPNWWGDMPMPMYTFIESYDFNGKTVIPFNTHGGSRFSNTISTLTNSLDGANVIQEGLTISRNDITDSQAEVVSWLQGLSY